MRILGKERRNRAPRVIRTITLGSGIAGILLAGMCFAIADQAEAQSLPALANVTANAGKQAALITASTGATAVIAGSSPLTGAAMAITDTGYDEATHHLFVVDVTNNKLLTINMTDGSVFASPTLSVPAGVTAVTDLEWDAGASTLFGIVTITGGDKQLATFNTSTGSVSLVGGAGIEGGFVGTFSQPFDLDAVGHRYYMVGSPAGGDKLYAINTGTGAVADSVLLAGKLPAGTNTIFGLEYDPGESKLYGLIGLTPSNDKQLISINTTSGATFGNITLLGAGGFGGGTAVSLSGAEALDPTGNIYYAKGSISGNDTLFAINTATGVATQHLLSFGPGINDVRAMEFDSGFAPSPPSISKSFAPNPITIGGVSTLTFTLTNPNSSTALTGAAFTDTFPAGLTVAATPNATTTGCGAPTFAPAAGNTSLSFSGGTIAASGTCTVTVDVTPTTAGSKLNTTGNVTSTNGGTGNTGTDTLTVIVPPGIAKAFSPNPIAAGGVSTLTFTLTNANSSTALTGAAFTDTFPAGLTVAATPNATTSGCGAPAFAPAAGNTSLSFTGGTIAASGTCTVTVDVTATTAGSKLNTTGNVTSTNGGPGNTGSDTLTVIAPPGISKSFAPNPIAVSGVSTLTFTVTNANSSTSLTGVAFADTFPAGLAVAATPNATTSGCGAPAFAPAAGNSSLSFTGGSIAASGTCTVTVDVTATTAGSKVNTTGNVTSTNGGTGNTGTGTLTVIAPPGISKSFAPNPIFVGGVSTLTFTVTNPNAGTSLTGIAFADTFPAGLVVAATPNATTTGCGAPAFAPAAGNSSLSFTGGTIAASSTCTVTVAVTPTTVGSKVNTTGNVTSTNGGTGNTGTDTLTASPPGIPSTSQWGLMLLALVLAAAAVWRLGAS